MAIEYKNFDEFLNGRTLDEHARRHGVSNFDFMERVKFITRAFFTEKSVKEQRRIELEITGIIDRAAALISDCPKGAVGAQLKTICAELEFIRDGFGTGKRPRGAKRISAAALDALAFRLPRALRPRALGGIVFDDFGHIEMRAIPLRKQDGASESTYTSAQSLLLPGQLLVRGAVDYAIACGIADGEELRSLGRLNEARDDKGEVTAAAIRMLTPAELAELQQRADDAIGWLMATFSIKADTDPMKIDARRLLAPRATAGIVYRLSHLIAPGLEYGGAVDIADLLSHPPNISGHRDVDEPIYWQIFEAIRWDCAVNGIDGELFARRANEVGLLPPRTKNLRRFIKNFGRLFRQIRELHRVRRHLIKALEGRGIRNGMSDRAPLGKTGDFLVGFDDYHNLGRWSDYLKGLLILGLVERGRDEGARLRLPSIPAWKSPPLVSHYPIDKIARLLVLSARKVADEDGQK